MKPNDLYLRRIRVDSCPLSHRTLSCNSCHPRNVLQHYLI